MAVDEILLDQASEQTPLVLRFYGWSPATLSLGYFQQLTDRASHPPSAACAVTRRLSGGGAILHDQELTYSIVVPPGHLWASDVQQLYDLVHEALIEALAERGIGAQKFGDLCVAAAASPDRIGPSRDSHANTGHSPEEPFLCFQRRTCGDVVMGGWKIAGSAQRRRRGAVLQHGSILLSRSKFAPELPGINDLGASLECETLRAAFQQQLSERAHLVTRGSELTRAECEAAEQLAREKYDCVKWWGRR